MTDAPKGEGPSGRWPVHVTCITVLTITTLAIAGAVALKPFRPFNPFAPSTQFRLFGDKTQLVNALAYEIADGDSFARVEQLLGSGDHKKKKTWIEIQIRSESSPEFMRQYPQGIELDDEFIAYHGTFQIVLQFRDGKLINHNRDWLRRIAN